MASHADDAPQTIAVDEKNALDLVKLTGWMEEHVVGFAGPLHYTKFAGGQSNPTYKLCAASGDYVLRRKPFGSQIFVCTYQKINHGSVIRASPPDPRRPRPTSCYANMMRNPRIPPNCKGRTSLTQRSLTSAVVV